MQKMGHLILPKTGHLSVPLTPQTPRSQITDEQWPRREPWGDNSGEPSALEVGFNLVIGEFVKRKFNVVMGEIKGLMPFSLVIEEMSPSSHQEARTSRLFVNKAADHMHSPEATVL